LPIVGQACVVGYGVIYWGSVARVVGRLSAVLGRWDEARHWLESAIEFERRVGAPIWRIRSQIDLAEVSVSQGRSVGRSEAASLLMDAQAEADRLGLVALANRARAVGRQLEVKWGLSQ
jgi:hypothetical protein